MASVDQTFQRDAAIRARRRLEEQLRHAQKMDAIGRITGGIAHDFNTLLLAIGLNLESLAEETRSSAPSQPLFDGTRHAIEQARDLIRQQLVVARRQPLKPTRFDVNQSVLESRLMLRRTLPTNIAIETVLGADVGCVFADRDQFETALLNLAVNARDAMPGGGRLTIGTAGITRDAAGVAMNPGPAAGRYAMIAVTDSSAGISEAVAARVRAVLYDQGRRGPQRAWAQPGLGYARQSDGQARIDPSSGRGATVRLPPPRSSGPMPARRQSEAAPGSTGGEAVLLVEDTPLVRGAVARMLSDLGYKVTAANGAEETLAMLESSSRIDLLFTDMALPGGTDGEELATVARRLRPGVRVLFTSGHAEMRLRDPAGENAGCSLLVKPYTKAELAAHLRAVFGRAAAPG